MNVFKCDRCGMYFDSFGVLRGARLGGDFLLSGVLQPGWYPARVELCADCANQVRDFLREWWAEQEKTNDTR